MGSLGSHRIGPVEANRGVMAHERAAVKALEAYKVMTDTQTSLRAFYRDYYYSVSFSMSSCQPLLPLKILLTLPLGPLLAVTMFETEKFYTSDKGAITSKIKHTIKLKTSPARLAQLLHNCCSPH